MKHPNAAAAVTAGTVSVVIVYIADVLGLEMPGEVGAAAGSLIIAGVLVLGRNGVRGIARKLWRGQP